jgi:hypothetical protein
MSSGELSQEFEDQLVSRLSFYTVGLLKEQKQPDGRTLNPSGSGVLVEVQGVRGIVTAGHVAVAIQKAANFALFTLSNRHAKAPALEISTTDLPIAYDYEPASAIGPDIGFIQLPRQTEEQLLANGNVFYSFDVRLEQAIAQTDEKPLGREVVCGVIAENSAQKSKSESQRTDVHEMTFGYGVSRNPKATDRNLDTFFFEIVHNELAKRPISYGGLSGAAVWRVGESLEARDRFIGGIAFHESDADANGNRIITCHGPKTIYRRLPELLAKAFPGQFN